MIFKILFFALILLLPLQFGRHFWPKASYLFGLKIDFLSPTIYLQDIIIIFLFFHYLPKLIPQIITALRNSRTLVRKMKAKQGFKLPWKPITKRLKACQRKPWAFSPGKLIKNKLLHSKLMRYFVKVEKFDSLSHSSPPKAGYSASRNKKCLILCLLYLLFAFLNIYFSITPLLSFFSWLRITEMIFLGLIVAKNSSLALKLMEKILPFSLFFEFILSLAQVLKQSSLNGLFWFLGERSFNILTPGIARATFLGEVFLRPYGTFSHPNSLAGFALVALIWIFTKEKLKIFDKLAVLAGILTIFLSFSRTVWLTAFILGLSYFLWQFKKNLQKGKFNLSFPYLALLIFLPISIFLFSRTVIDSSSFIIRLDLANFALLLIKKFPLFGVGAGQFIMALSQGKVVWPSLYWLQPVHNIFLLVAAETGLLGLTAFLGILFWAIKRIILLPNSRFKFKILASLLVILFTGLFDHYSLTLIQNQLLFVFVLASSLTYQNVKMRQ